MLGLFKRSIESKQKIIIFYIDSENKITERYIRVLQINEKSILAYCYYRRKVRTFNMENILSVGKARKKVGA
jgi:predicted DNA-binding transcriptional regulator YafY